AVVEAHGTGLGTSGSSTGNLYAPVGSRLYGVEARHGREALREVAAARAFAVDLVERSVQEFALDCDFQRVPFHLFALEGGRAREDVEKECAAARNAGLPTASNAPEGF